MKKIFSKEIKIGIAFIVGLFLLFFGIKFLKGVNIFKPSNVYIGVFDNVSGLNISSPVLLNGFQVGLVTSMKVEPSIGNKIIVYMTMNKGVNITTGSKLKLEVSMLGTSSLLLEMNPYTKDYITVNDTLHGSNVVGMMDKVQKDMLPQIVQMLPHIDTILIGVQRLVNNPALQTSLTNVDATTKNLQQATQSLNQMMASLNTQIPGITSNLATTTNNFSQLSSKFNKLDYAKTYSSIDSAMHNLQILTQKLNRSDNSMGLLLNNRDMYDSLKIAIGNTSLLLEDLRKNPKKYINLKVF